MRRQTSLAWAPMPGLKRLDAEDTDTSSGLGGR